uniref:Uncharacterized protein n=1 Tax=Trypanosoma vivax (strain Y486) TaxID=1055687 RepID=G0TXB9_TRYVY|nr:conserved hypothetical protein [Trypanosoma vivax Y486]
MKGRNMPGAAAFEVALQHILVRHDRSYHFVRFLIAITSLVFTLEICLIFISNTVLPFLIFSHEGILGLLLDFTSYPLAVSSAVFLVLLRAGSQRYGIESGKRMMQRLNDDIMGPCLGMHFDYATGKISSDEMWSTDSDLLVNTDYTSQT